MQPAAAGNAEAKASSDQDLFFQCDRCGAALVVDCAAAGMILDCQECGQPTVVPLMGANPGEPESPGFQEADLRRHLKENESQRTEITGYINQLQIQLHRWQLRLQTLNERNAELNAQINALHTTPPPTEG